MNKTKLILVVVFLAFTAITFIHPIYPREQSLQHAGTVLLLIPLIADVMRNRMPMSAFVGILLFAVLHGPPQSLRQVRAFVFWRVVVPLPPICMQAMA